MMRNGKGLMASIAFFMIIGLLVIISIWIFFIFFKVQVTNIAVDVDNVNRYQEVPTSLLGITLRSVSDDELSKEYYDKCKDADWWAPSSECTNLAKIFRALKGIEYKDTTYAEINCFRGNGPAGTHDPIDKLCTKHVAFYHSKFINGLGNKTLSGADRVTDSIRISLPVSCYRLSLEGAYTEEGGPKDELVSKDELSECEFNVPKLDEVYPMPIFRDDGPSVAVQRILIASSLQTGSEILINWPKHDICFENERGCGREEK